MTEVDGAAAGQRLDKWLWFARVIKTRKQAAGLVTNGKVRVNRQRVDKPSTTVRPGDVVTVTVRGAVRVLEIKASGVRRGPPVEAQTLFEDRTPASAKPAGAETHRGEPLSNPSNEGVGQRDAGSGRPSKRERRQFNRLTDR